jgi:hypothetical protein
MHIHVVGMCEGTDTALITSIKTRILDATNSSTFLVLSNNAVSVSLFNYSKLCSSIFMGTSKTFTERRGRVLSTPSLCSGGPGFKS